MFRNTMLRGVSAGALSLFVSASLAQEALPTIDIDAETAPRRSTTTTRSEESGGRLTGYAADLETPAVSGKDKIPILRNPVSIQIVPRQVLDDQQAISVADAVIGNVSSVRPGPNSFYDSFTIRGLPDASVFRNNLTLFSIIHLQTANLQSIEVLKGPAAMLFGRLEPGGVVNLVVKRPLDTPYFSFQQQTGSFGHTRTTIDATGPLTQDKDWLYRLNLSFNRSDSFRDFVSNQDAFIAPTISWRPSEQFRFNLDFEYQNTIFVADTDSVIPAVRNRPANIPISRYLQEPALTRDHPSRLERTLAAFDWTYDISADWSVTNRFHYFNSQWAQKLAGFSITDAKSGDYAHWTWDVNTVIYGLATSLDVNGKFETGPFRHEVLIGSDYFDESRPGVGVSGDLQRKSNIYAPTYLPGYIKPANNFYGPFRQSWKGVYGQDMISFLDDRAHVLLGGRHDWATYGYGYSPTSFAESIGPYDPATGNGYQGSADEAWSPRLGLVLQPQPWVSLYANYTRSFGLTNGIPTPGNAPLPAERALQWEGGVKAELLDKNLTVTVAYYDITKSGIVQSIPGSIFSQPVGLVESKGVELDVAGKIDDQWSLIGNYAYNDARIIADASGTPASGGKIGNRLQNAPGHSGSLWVKYAATEQFAGLSLGGGVTAVGERQGDNDNSFQLPAYARIDAMVSYRLPAEMFPWAQKATLQFNIRNLNGVTYYTHAFHRDAIYPGEPRNFLASLRVEF